MNSCFTSPFGGEKVLLSKTKRKRKESRGRIMSVLSVSSESELKNVDLQFSQSSHSGLTLSFLPLIPPSKGETLWSLRLLMILLIPFFSISQTFPPAPGIVGSTAIYKDSSIIEAWATDSHIERGLKNITNPSAGYAAYGDDDQAIGPAEGNSTNIISLGDSGNAVLTFDRAIMDGVGPDFAVFENGFADDFIELAFVEVSSDGMSFYRFPSISEAPILQQIGPFEFSDCRYFNNLAGKYRQGYGTPFDLSEMAGIDGLDINAITHVKLIDVIGSIDPLVGSFDSEGTIINDLFPTEFDTGGFDLDAVGVIHQAPLSVDEKEIHYSIYPNPTKGLLTIDLANESHIRILDITGKLLFEEVIMNKKVIDLSTFSTSCVFIEISNASFRKIEKIAIQ